VMCMTLESLVGRIWMWASRAVVSGVERSSAISRKLMGRDSDACAIGITTSAGEPDDAENRSAEACAEIHAASCPAGGAAGITTPRLRDHPADIPILVRHFTRKYAAKMNKRIDKIQSETMQALVSWPWPGNVRELENFLERSVILSQGPVLRAPLAELRAEAVEGAGGTLAEMEREYIIRVLRESNSVISAAANRLGVPRTTLNAMMRKLGIARKDY